MVRYTLISTFLEDENVGVAGSKIVYSNDKLQKQVELYGTMVRE